MFKCKIIRDESGSRLRKYVISIYFNEDLVYNRRFMAPLFFRFEKRLKRVKARAFARAKLMVEIAAK